MKRMYKKIIILLIFCMSLIGGQRLLIGDNGLIFTSAEENRNMSQETVISSLAEDVTTFWIHFSDGETIIDSQEVVYGTTPQFAPYSVEEGYEFLGWKDGPKQNDELITDSTGKLLSPWKYDHDITVYPEIGYKEYTITYISNGGPSMDPDTFTMMDKVTLPEITKYRYRFMGWYDNPELTGNKIIEVPKNTKEDKIFYAKWAFLYKVTYVDGSSPIHTEYGIEGETIKLYKYDKVGYTAVWTGNRKAGSDYVVGNKDVNLYVEKWEAHTFSIRLYENYTEGDGKYTRITVTYGQTYQLKVASRGYNYVFFGWYSKDEHEISADIPRQRRFTGADGNSLTIWNDDKGIDLIAEFAPRTVELVGDYERKDKYTITDSGDYSGGEDKIIVSNYCGYTLTELYRLGYQTLHITIQFDAWEKDEGYQWIIIYDSSGKRLDDIRIEHGGSGKDTYHERYQIDFYIALYENMPDTIYVRYGAQGWFSDTWYNENANVWIDGLVQAQTNAPTCQVM